LGINEVKKLMIACAAMALLGSAAHAELKQKMVGNWMVRSQDHAFDKGGTYTMLVANGGFGFSVCCIQKSPSFGIVLLDQKLTEGQLFTVKLRVDRGDIVEVDGVAISEHLIETANDFKIWKALPGGRELAINLETEAGTSQTRVFKISGAASALPTVTSECPIKDETAASGDKK
jgi:hypothetical protein